MKTIYNHLRRVREYRPFIRRHSEVLVLLFVLLLTAIIFFAWVVGRRMERSLGDVWLQALEERVADVGDVLNRKDSYFVVDTAYLAKLNELFYYGPVPPVSAYPDEDVYSDMMLAADNILLNIRRGVRFSSNLWSTYLLLAEPDAPNVIVNGRVTAKDDLTDVTWLTTCAEMVNDTLIEWRTLSLSYSRSVDVLSTYVKISSTHWLNGEQYDGYLVMNYELSSVINQISAQLNATESVYLYNIAQDSGLFIGSENKHEALASRLLQDYLTNDRDSSGVIFRQSDFSGRIYYWIEDAGDSFAFVVLKQDMDLSSIVSDGYLFFVFMLLLCSGVILVFGFVNLRQYRNYGDGLRKILALADNKHTEALPEITPLQHTDYNQIVERLLSNTIDLDELDALLQSEKDLRTELELLYGHVQINSHFLLNTMDSIYWSSVQTNGPSSDESIMIENLCMILKYALDSSDLYAPLEEEIKSVRMYLHIQEIRKKMHFTVDWTVPDNLFATKVGKLTMQPILENCIQHGMHDGMDKLHISVTAKLQGQLLVIAISDNGKGISPTEIYRLNRQFRSGSRIKNRHIGLSNVNRRIQVQYGQEYGLTLSRSEQGGLCVTMYLNYAVYGS